MKCNNMEHSNTVSSIKTIVVPGRYLQPFIKEKDFFRYSVFLLRSDRVYLDLFQYLI